jgi:hypothetical protein
MLERIHLLKLLVPMMLAGCLCVSGQSRRASLPMRAPVVRNVSRPPIRTATPLRPNSVQRGVPGLGFDYEHLAVVNRPAQNRSGRLRARGFGFITPIFGAGLPYYYSFDNGVPMPDDHLEDQQQSPAPDLPPPATADSSALQNESGQGASQAPASAPELGPLILVRRDGQVLLVAAFMASSGRLTYVTRDGLRRSFPIGELDKSATREINDANGTSVALPD